MKQNVIIGLLVAILGILILPIGGSESVLGGAGCNSGNCTDFDAVNTSAGYYVDDVQIIDGSGDIVSGDIDTTGSVSVGPFTQGGAVLGIASGAQTLTQAQLSANSILVATASTTAEAFSWTLPASSTLTTLLPTAGDSRLWLFENRNGAATTTTFVAGTGIVLLEPDGQNVVIGGGNKATIECWRDNTTDVLCNIDELIDAD